MHSLSWTRRSRLWALLVLLVLATGAASAHAQSDAITLTLAVPEFFEQSLPPDLLAGFEAENPGVNVEIVGAGFPFFPPAAVSLDEHLTSVSDFVSAADVQLITLDRPLTEATRAGYFLDLAPLANADPTLDTADFVPVAWESVQWDGGVWALPTAYDLVTLVYSPALFDQAGIPYPSPTWTLTDLGNAARALTRFNADGGVEQAGLLVFDTTYVAALLRSLLGSSLSDTASDTPLFSQPALESLLEEWAALVDEGVVSTTFSGGTGDLPMQLSGTFALATFSPGDEASSRQSALLRRAYGELAMMDASIILLGDLLVDRGRGQVRRGEQVINLTPIEFRLLVYLAQNSGQALSRQQIIDAVWGYESDPAAMRTINVHIRRLREKIELNPDEPSLILTVPGIGYRLTTGAS